MSVSSGGATVYVLRLLGKSSFPVRENKTNMQNEAKPSDSKKSLMMMFVFLGPDMPEAE